MSKKKTSRNLKELNINDGKIDFTENVNQINFQIKNKIPLTNKQKCFLQKAHDSKTKCCIIAGVAGTSKTFLGMLLALEKLRDGKIDQIVSFRTTVQAKDSETGFLPGEWIGGKDQFFIGPFEQKLNELLDVESVNEIKKNHLFKFLPTAALRGMSFNRTCIILSEAQNASLSTLIDLICRAGEDSFVIVEGDDLFQNDWGHRSGFAEFVRIFSDYDSSENGVLFERFKEEDIVRSEFVKFVMNKYAKYVKNK